MEKPYLSLQPSEIALLGAVSRIYAAYIVSGHADGDEKNMQERSLDEALRLARLVEQGVQSDRELG